MHSHQPPPEGIDASGARTLFVTVDPAWPPVSGADLRNWQNAVAACARGAVVIASLAAARRPIPGTERVRGAALSDAAPGDIWGTAPATGAPLLAIPEGAETRFARLVETFDPATIVLEHPALLDLLPTAGTPMRPEARLVFDFHNVESAMAAEAARRRLPFRLAGWRALRRTARRIAATERRAAEAADAVWVCSPEEAVRLRRCVSASPAIHVVPNGIPRPETTPMTLAPRAAHRGGPSILFAGHLSYPPNMAAAGELALEILPALHRAGVEATLVIAGRRPAPDVLRLGRRHGVTVTADPADMAGLLAEADLVALPIRAGGGTRIKVLDAMAHGVPVVATRLAVEGLGVIETLHFHRAETVRDFVRAIAHIAAGADVEPMRAAAWRHCLRHFGPEAIAEAVTLGLAAP